MWFRGGLRFIVAVSTTLCHLRNVEQMAPPVLVDGLSARVGCLLDDRADGCDEANDELSLLCRAQFIEILSHRCQQDVEAAVESDGCVHVDALSLVVVSDPEPLGM